MNYPHRPIAITWPKRTGTYIVAMGLLLMFAVATRQPADAQTYSVLYTFTGGNDGGDPYSNVIRDSAGNLYGTAAIGGGDGSCNSGFGCGVLFKLSPSGTETVLHVFGEGTDGQMPKASLFKDAHGNIYGTTSAGGTLGFGTVYKLDTSGTVTTIFNFSGANGSDAQGVVVDASGTIYGSTLSGGDPAKSGKLTGGVLYKLTQTGVQTILRTFEQRPGDGYFPFGVPLLDGAGNIYATTSEGGQSHAGTVYRYNSSDVVTQIFLAGQPGPFQPQGGLVFDGDGYLYGPSYGGSPLGGQIFRVDGRGHVTTFSNFGVPSVNGDVPNASLIFDSAGNIYGTSSTGGSTNGGVVFKVDTSGNETVLYDFADAANGQTPVSGLTIDSAGNLYGTTVSGGFGHGVVFKITP